MMPKPRILNGNSFRGKGWQRHQLKLKNCRIVWRKQRVELSTINFFGKEETCKAVAISSKKNCSKIQRLSRDADEKALHNQIENQNHRCRDGIKGFRKDHHQRDAPGTFAVKA